MWQPAGIQMSVRGHDNKIRGVDHFLAAGARRVLCRTLLQIPNVWIKKDLVELSFCMILKEWEGADIEFSHIGGQVSVKVWPLTWHNAHRMHPWDPKQRLLNANTLYVLTLEVKIQKIFKNYHQNVKKHHFWCFVTSMCFVAEMASEVCALTI